ncbi:MAG: secondary thiamine-phosphate synthase enzyme YjbQ [Oscillospiraceae bacterium]|nr:secondary thiamine-phosphate synthase enzyme YjbQ [Oscillospiraceae bacterium]
MKTLTLELTTSSRSQMLNITDSVRQAVRGSGVTDGTVTVFVPHTTAGVTINENADPDVVRDILYELDKIVPWEDGYRHYEGNSATHIKASMMGSSVTVILENGKLLLGTWQGIYFCEFDGPRTRHFLVKVSEG